MSACTSLRGIVIFLIIVSSNNWTLLKGFRALISPTFIKYWPRVNPRNSRSTPGEDEIEVTHL